MSHAFLWDARGNPRASPEGTKGSHGISLVPAGCFRVPAECLSRSSEVTRGNTRDVAGETKESHGISRVPGGVSLAFLRNMMEARGTSVGNTRERAGTPANPRDPVGTRMFSRETQGFHGIPRVSAVYLSRSSGIPVEHERHAGTRVSSRRNLRDLSWYPTYSHIFPRGVSTATPVYQRKTRYFYQRNPKDFRRAHAGTRRKPRDSTRS